jgi:hypothetical protein
MRHPQTDGKQTTVIDQLDAVTQLLMTPQHI